MSAVTFKCSQCLYSDTIAQAVHFCPRCGLAVDTSADANDPVALKVRDDLAIVNDLLAQGDLCNLYRCELPAQKRQGIFKIARSHRGNAHVAREIATLRRLHDADGELRFVPFLPEPIGSIQYGQSVEPTRMGNVLAFFGGVAGPDHLFSVEQVKHAYPEGIDARDMAWMWRRLLKILGFVHRQNLAHGVVTPDHILIEPAEHKLVLIGWSAAAPFGMPPHLMPVRWRNWSGLPKDGADANGLMTASAAHDLAYSARSMSYLLGAKVEPGVARHLQRAAKSTDAWKLLDDFDKLIEALWGPRQFRPFVMPAAKK